MNEYEKYMCCNILLDAYAKYQGKCMDYLHSQELKIAECNLYNHQNDTYKAELEQNISDVKKELTNITNDLKELSSVRANLLTDMQTGVDMQNSNIDFNDLKY